MQLSEQNVKEVVINASFNKAVFLYFYQEGPQCAPTTQALESQIAEDNAYLSLVKANIVEPISQAIAMQLGLRGVPALIVFKDGKPVDAMQGNEIATALPDLMAKYMPSEADMLMREALSLEASDNLQDALSKASKAYELDTKLEYKHILARLCIKTKNLSRAHELLDNPGREESSSKDYQDLISALTLAEQASESPEIKELEAKYAENKKDSDIVQKLGAAYAGAGKNKEALEILFEYLKEDLGNENVKKTFLDILNTMSGDPLQNQYRRKLYTLMY